MANTQTVSSLSADTPEWRESLSVVDPAALWFVRSGAVQVFAVRNGAGRTQQALRPLFQVTAGQTLLGVPQADRFGLTLVTRRIRGGEITVAPRGTSGDVAEDGFGWLESWIVELSRCAAGDRMMHSAHALAHGGYLCVDDQARTVSSSESVAWVRQVSGRSRFLGRSELVIPEGTLYPLSQAAFVEAEPRAELAVVDGLTCRAADVWNGIDLFHTHVFRCIAEALDCDDEAARQYSREREHALEHAVSLALRDLASPLQQPANHDPVLHPEAWDTPLMRACQMIGNSLDVQMKPHPDLVRGVAVKNPVTAIAQVSGVRYRRVALSDEWWRHSSEPLLVFRASDNRPIALIPRLSCRGYRGFDPVTGSTAPLDTATIASLSRFGYMFYRPLPATPLVAWDLLAFGLRGSRRELQLIVTLSLAAGLLALMTPFVTGVLFDSIIPNAQRSELLSMALVLIVAAISAALFNMARGFAVLRLQGRLSVALQAGLWDRLLSLPVPFFRDYAAGDLAERSLAFSHIRTILTGSTLNALLSGIFSVTSFGLLVYYSPRLSLVAIAMTIGALLVTTVAAAFNLKFQRRISNSSGMIMGDVVAFITAIAKFRLTCSERRAFVLWAKQFAAQKRTDMAARRITTLTAMFNSVYLPACIGTLFYINALLQQNAMEALTTGYFLAFLAAFGQFMAAALRVGAAGVTVASAVPIYERASPIFLALPEVSTTHAASSELTGDVEAHHVTFRYRPDAPLVLRGVSFRVQAGEFVAFVGPSGCGKSTLLRLLLGFELPESGALYYDGKDVSGLDLQGIRRQMGVVLQNETLLAGSIKDNICGTAGFTIHDVWQAARLAALHEDIQNMPLGMRTMITGGGGGLSGGQRQRVLIARAVIGRPRLLLFDEATSSLDNRTQATISKHLKTLKATRIVVAHRLSTIVDADRIFVMERGQIVQAGTYDELMSQPGTFRKLTERQML
jgi:NHLM bacteriocin system ABC transporter ATP-binding protein